MSDENGLAKREETAIDKPQLTQLGIPRPEGRYTRGDYVARGLEIRSLGAPLSVRIIEGNQLLLVAEGTEKERKSVWGRLEDGVLVIGGGSKSSSRGGGSVSNVVISGGNISISGLGGRVRINGVEMGSGEPESTLKVTIGVPKGCPIFLNKYSDEATIGDTEAPLKADVLDRGNIHVGRIADAILTASNHSNVEVVNVSGALVANVGGHSTVEVKGGDVQACTFNVAGHSTGAFSGLAQMGMLNASGHSNIYVAHVTNEPLRTQDRHSNVRVGNVG